MAVFQSFFYFLLAGLCEIGGGYLIWLWLREGKGLGFALAGALVLILYGIIPNPATGPFRTGLCRLWRSLHCFIHSVGMAGRQNCSRSL